MLKVLCFHNATSRASYRYRVGQFLPYWKEHNIDMHAVSISGRQYSNILKYLFKLHQYDYILLQKKIIPRALIKFIAKQSKLVYDFDDALYAKESGELQKNSAVSGNTITKLHYILKNSSVVFAGSNELLHYAETFNSHAFLIPTGLEQQLPQPVTTPCSDHITIGWIGNDVNLFYLSMIDEATSFLQQKYPQLRFSVMCANPPENLKTVWDFNKWSTSSEKSWLQSIDIGIMPLTDDPWSRGKCAFKLLQYMACGKPVVASDVGANRTTVSHTINGYLTNSSEEWISALEQLILDREKRVSMGRESLRIFMENFERGRIQQKIAYILHDFHKRTG